MSNPDPWAEVKEEVADTIGCFLPILSIFALILAIKLLAWAIELVP